MIIQQGLIYEATYGNKLQLTGFVDGFQTNILVIPEEVEGKKVIQISPSAFANNTCIEKVSMPESMEFIGTDAFENCSNLETVELTPVANFKQALTLTIGCHAFSNCCKLSQFISKDRIVTLQAQCFRDCIFLSNLNVYIQQVEALSFFCCNSLREIKFSYSARLDRNSLTNSSIKSLKFKGDGIIPQSTLKFISEHNIKITCVPESNLENLAYCGYIIEITDKQNI